MLSDCVLGPRIFAMKSVPKQKIIEQGMQALRGLPSSRY